MSEYYLREIMYELYGIADVVTNGKSVEDRKERHKLHQEIDRMKLEILSGRGRFEQKPE